MTSGRNIVSGALLGVGLAAFVDETVFHQLLHWHHFYDRSTLAAGLVSDGLFHAFGWFAAVVSLFMLADLGRRRRLSWLRWIGGVALGAGAFQLYDGTIVPANYPLAAAERERRLELFYRPYQDAVGAMIASVAAASGAAPFIFSVHSFTPVMQGHVRPWHVGVLWDLDDRAPRPLIDMLKADATLVVGDNEPYDGALRGDTMFKHAIVNGFAHALIEIRQDLIADDSGAEAWAARLAPIIDAINARPDIHEVRQCGSRTGPL